MGKKRAKIVYMKQEGTDFSGKKKDPFFRQFWQKTGFLFIFNFSQLACPSLWGLGLGGDRVPLGPVLCVLSVSLVVC